MCKKARRISRTTIMALLVAVLVAVLVMPVDGAFAASKTYRYKPKNDSNTTRYTVVAKRQDRIKYRWGGYVTTIRTEKNSSYKNTYTKEKVFAIKTYKGYVLDKVYVDGVNRGAVTSVVFPEGTTGDHTIKATFKRVATFIMIDPGHETGTNKGCYVKGLGRYYEGNQMWYLANRLKAYLEKYPNVVVGMTKSSMKIGDKQIGVYPRGVKAKGYDIFISMHSNYVSSPHVDYPLAIVSSSKGLQSVSGKLGKNLATKMKSTMGLRNALQVWQKKDKYGNEWFGVIRGSASVKVPGILLENSFHSNPRVCKYLMTSTKRNTLAKNYAAVIASYYGISQNGSLATPRTPEGFRSSGKKGGANISWYQVPGATGYQIYRSESSSGGFRWIRTTNNSASMSYSDTDSKLRRNKRYYYKVRSVRNTPSSTKYSGYSRVDYATVK